MWKLDPRLLVAPETQWCKAVTILCFPGPGLSWVASYLLHVGLPFSSLEQASSPQGPGRKRGHCRPPEALPEVGPPQSHSPQRMGQSNSAVQNRCRGWQRDVPSVIFLGSCIESREAKL